MSDDESLAYARHRLRDWPDCAMIDILQGDVLAERIHPLRA